MVWAVIISVILLMFLYAWVSGKISERRRKKSRERTMPTLQDQVQAGVKYNLVLNSGAKFENVELLGVSGSGNEGFSFWGYEGMLVLAREDGKKLYVKPGSIKYAEEI